MATSDRAARKDRMRAAAARRAEPDAPAAGVTAIRSKPVRITVDLSPEDYRRLMAWTTAAAAELDVPKVTAADAIRAMVRTVDLDKGIGAVVADMIRRDREQ
jgi:hypothetical protein